MWDFPPELESLIFDTINATEVYDRKSNHDHRHPHVLTRAPEVTKTLLACSSVSRVWRKHALEHIFRIMTLTRSYYVAEMLRKLKRNRTVEFRIDSLIITKAAAPLDKWDIAQLAPILTCLRSLVVEYSPQMYFLGGIVPNLRFLALTITFPLLRQEILVILREVPRLKVLHLHGNWPGGNMPTSVEDQPFLTNKFEEISISCLAFISEEQDCWRKLLQSSAESLHSVAINRHIADSARFFTTAFRCVGKTVKHLTMTHDAFLEMAETLLQLCPNLTHATLDLWWLLRNQETVVPTFPSSLTSIHLCVYVEWLGEGGRDDAGRDLKSLADIFLVPAVANRLTQLRELVLDIPHYMVLAHSLNFADFMNGLEERLSVVRPGIKCRCVEFRG